MPRQHSIRPSADRGSIIETLDLASDAYAKPINNLDAMRFWAALCVLWSHAVAVSYGPAGAEPLFSISHGQTTLGTVSVGCFFVMSGFLVTRSFERSRDAWQYLVARGLRILPALFLVSVLVAFAMGPLVTTWPLTRYFGSSEPYHYVWTQISLVHFVDRLPGVFESNPLPFVNGPLWTLHYEVFCYGLVLLFGVLRLLRRDVVSLAYIAMLLFIGVQDAAGLNHDLHLTPHSLMFDLIAKFAAGALIYQWRMRLRWEIALACLAVTIVCLLTSHFQLALRTVFPYAVMYAALGTNWRLPGLTQYGDLSYGMYIYAWPIEQLIVMYSGAPHWLITGSVATVLALGVAFVSWHGVERVALSLKRTTRPSLARSTERGVRAGIAPVRVSATRLSSVRVSHRRSARRYRSWSR